MSSTGLTRVFAYEGKQIRSREDEKVNLTDMWRASGAERTKSPTEWLRSAQAQAMVEFLADSQATGDSRSLVSSQKGNPRTGDGGSTWAHWQLAIAYAKYLSPAFHVWCNEIIRREMRPPKEAAPRLDAATVSSSRVGESPTESKRLRLAVTRVRKARGYTTQKVHGFIRQTRHVSLPFFLSSHLLDAVIEDLEMLEAETVSLPTRARRSLPARSTSQIEMFDPKKAH